MQTRTMAVVGILLGMGVLATAWSSINMALASIQAELGATVLQLQWMMNTYGICICIPLLALGKLGDSHGRKQFYIAGLFGLLLSCLGAAFAKSPGWIIGCLALFGLSGASVLTLSQALVVHQYPEEMKGKAVALWATFTSLALAMGPLMAGIILRFVSWRGIFLFEVFIAIIALILVALFVKKEQTHEAHCDWSGVLLLALIVGTLVTAIMQGPTWGWSSFGVLGFFLLAILSLIAFVLVERKSQDPLFRPDLFAHRGFLFSSLCNGCLIGFIWSIFFFFPLYMQNAQGFSPLQTGLTMLLTTVPVAIFSVPISKLYLRIGAKTLMAGGFSILLLAVLFQAWMSLPVSCLLIGFGWVMSWGPSAATALTSLPHRMAGIASGMFMTLQEIGGVLGLAAAGVVFRMGSAKFLNPHMEKITQALGDKTPDLLSDPVAAEAMLGKHAKIVPWLYDGFFAGYKAMLLCLVVLTAIGILFALLVPRSSKMKV